MSDYTVRAMLRRNGYTSYAGFGAPAFISPYSNRVLSVEQAVEELEEHQEPPPSAVTVTLHEGKKS
jgi:hypothetical protein